jgi:hypothetical protein
MSLAHLDGFGDRAETHARIQNRVIVHELLEYQPRIRFERGVEREEDLTVFLNGQVLDKVQPIWKGYD